jgi:hypothetical protein
MEKSTAQGLIAQYLKYEKILHRITELSYEIDDVETQNGVRRAACDAQCYLYEGLVQPVVKEYPGLAPHDNQIREDGEGSTSGRAPKA